MTSSILSINGVTKAFRDNIAVNNLTMEVPTGSIFGLLGPNGAGKTTLIRMINQINYPDSGEIIFDGNKLNGDHISSIGYMPEERGLYPKMKIGEQLLYFAQLKGLSASESKKRMQDWLVKFEALDWVEKRANELSKGMQQKIQFIATVIHEPKFLILDEPLSGLDPVNADLINQEILRLNKNGTTVMFSTHRMEQVEELCDNIVLINKGKKVLEGGVDQVKQNNKEGVFELGLNMSKKDLLEKMKKLGLDKKFELVSFDKAVLKVVKKVEMEAGEVLRLFVCNDFGVASFREVLPSLHEIFVKSVK